jgi:hypothetical protein
VSEKCQLYALENVTPRAPLRPEEPKKRRTVRRRRVKERRQSYASMESDGGTPKEETAADAAGADAAGAGAGAGPAGDGVDSAEKAEGEHPLPPPIPDYNSSYATWEARDAWLVKWGVPVGSRWPVDYEKIKRLEDEKRRREEEERLAREARQRWGGCTS